MDEERKQLVEERRGGLREGVSLAACILPVQHKNNRRIGGLRGRPYRFTAKFDHPEGNAAIADSFKSSAE